MRKTNRALENAQRNPDITVIEERPVRRRNRGGRKTQLDGITFDSNAEAQRYARLVLWLRAGRIANLKVHPKYVLQRSFVHPSVGRVRAVTWTADFSYMQTETKLHVIEDLKGYEYRSFKVKLPFILHFFRQCHVFVNHDIDGWYSPPTTA